MAAVGLVLAGGLVAHAAGGTAAVRAPGFSFSRTPSARTVAQGSSATFTVSLTRDTGFTGDVSVQTTGLPSGASGVFAPAVLSGSQATSTLTVSVASSAPTGTFTFSIVGTGGGKSHTRTATLDIAPAINFGISGNAGGPLYPGGQSPLDLTLSNPYGFDISVTRIAVHLAGTTKAGCYVGGTRTSFAVIQLASAAYPLRIPAGSSVNLSGLGVAAGQQPQLVMLNTGFNQDACRGASVNLTYTGKAGRAP